VHCLGRFFKIFVFQTIAFIFISWENKGILMKDKLRAEFSKNYEKYYKVKLFDELGFKRRKCKNCGKFFWSISERENCPDSTCQRYEFIGHALKKIDYVDTWKAIEKFFVKNDHEPIKTYPVVCRWFPGLYFTVASIVAFQRSVAGKTVFEMPANPLIIPQVCLRFNDIPNVGVTGRHLTNFVMIGQHSIYDGKKGYWKDQCIDYDYRLLTEVFKIKSEEISWLEDVWVGPSAFGYSLEYYVKGLELGNAVFTEFVGTPDKYEIMNEKVIDMGAGLERFAWLMNGTPTCYDVIFGDAMTKLKKKVKYDKDLFLRYAKTSGEENVSKDKIASILGIDLKEMNDKIAPLEAIYAIADHSKTLLYAITDGGLPSNVGGGYNLRVILRRALSFIDEFGFDINLSNVCKWHAKYLKKLDPRLAESLNEVDEILKVEEERYKRTKSRVRDIVEKIINTEINEEKLIQLYESEGVTPELIKEEAEKLGKEVAIPMDFYAKISERHMQEKEEEKKIDINLSGLAPTELLYRNSDKTEFDAKVVRISEDWVILDKTLFYPESGGQDHDLGVIDKIPVTDVQKFGSIVAHKLEKNDLKENQVVHGIIDKKRRFQLMQHHTSIHIINGAARKILGNHVWQAGSGKSEEKAHLDITHYQALTEKEIEKIENLANKIIKKKLPVKKYILPRQVAEKRYSMRIYQGGAIPESELRIIEIPGFDSEACGGTHLNNTGEVGELIILSTERIQDGIVRITIAAGEAAERYEKEKAMVVEECRKILGTEKIIPEARKLFDKWKKLRKHLEKNIEKSAESESKNLEKKIVNNVLIEIIENADMKHLQSISKILSNDDRIIMLFGISDKIYVFGAAGSKTKVDIGKIVTKTCSELGGKGGGTKFLGQGIGTKKDNLNNVVEKLRKDLI